MTRVILKYRIIDNLDGWRERKRWGEGERKLKMEILGRE